MLCHVQMPSVGEGILLWRTVCAHSLVVSENEIKLCIYDHWPEQHQKVN